MEAMESLRYPVGRVEIPEIINNEQINEWIHTIETFPEDVAAQIAEMTSEELQYKYRPDGWTVHQVVNHCMDSHTNSVVRFKWTLTEDVPTIKAYREERWAELHDTLAYDPKETVLLLKGLHQRWVFLLKSLTQTQLERAYVHPEKGATYNLKQTICQYAWHCRHHLNHIMNAKKYKY